MYKSSGVPCSMLGAQRINTSILFRSLGPTCCSLLLFVSRETDVTHLQISGSSGVEQLTEGTLHPSQYKPQT